MDGFVVCLPLIICKIDIVKQMFPLPLHCYLITPDIGAPKFGA